MPKLHTENDPTAKAVLELHPFPEINPPSEDPSDQYLADFWMCLTNKHSQLRMHSFIYIYIHTHLYIAATTQAEENCLFSAGNNKIQQVDICQ